MVKDNALFEIAKDDIKEKFLQKVYEEDMVENLTEYLKKKVIDYQKMEASEDQKIQKIL